MIDVSFLAVLTAMLTIATPLAFGALGAILGERTGVLNLGIEGTMYAGAFGGFLAAEKTGSLWAGVVAAIGVGAVAGALMALLTVTIGVNQHVAGIGITLGLVAASDYTNRLLYNTGTQTRSPKFSALVRRRRDPRAVPTDVLRVPGRRPAAVVGAALDGCRVASARRG